MQEGGQQRQAKQAHARTWSKIQGWLGEIQAGRSLSSSHTVSEWEGPDNGQQSWAAPPPSTGHPPGCKGTYLDLDLDIYPGMDLCLDLESRSGAHLGTLDLDLDLGSCSGAPLGTLAGNDAAGGVDDLVLLRDLAGLQLQPQRPSARLPRATDGGLLQLSSGGGGGEAGGGAEGFAGSLGGGWLSDPGEAAGRGQASSSSSSGSTRSSAAGGVQGRRGADLPPRPHEKVAAAQGAAADRWRGKGGGAVN